MTALFTFAGRRTQAAALSDSRGARSTEPIRLPGTLSSRSNLQPDPAAATPMAPGLHAARCDFAANTEDLLITSRKYRARAASVGLWPFASYRASGSAARLRSRRRSRLCCGPTARRRTHCIAPRNSARQDTKFDAKHPTVHPQSRRLMFPDIAPARTSNVSTYDSLCALREAGFHRRIKPDCEFRKRNRQ